MCIRDRLSADKDTATYKVGIDPTKVAETTKLTYKDNDGADKTVTLKKGLNFKKDVYKRQVQVNTVHLIVMSSTLYLI